jgi:hypothetical protein
VILQSCEDFVLDAGALRADDRRVPQQENLAADIELDVGALGATVVELVALAHERGDAAGDVENRTTPGFGGVGGEHGNHAGRAAKRGPAGLGIPGILDLLPRASEIPVPRRFAVGDVEGPAALGVQVFGDVRQ